MYAGRQWLFTPSGLETAGPLDGYLVPAAKFTQMTERDGETVYEWPIHVAEATSLDLEEFIRAFRRP